jgi:uncharacterized iron-regulated membrane protein
MIRKGLFWIHLVLGVSAGAFILIMAATGVMLGFERQISDFIDRDIRWVSVPYAPEPPAVGDLLEAVRRSRAGEPSAIVVRNAPQTATQFSIGRETTIYVDPYSGAILGSSSAAARKFFFAVERLHRTLGAPLGSKGLGHWLAAISNLLFAGLILLGIVLWLPRKWSWKAIRASIAFRSGLRGRAREWNWHNVLGIWCAAPLLVIALTGVVMSFPWANTLLFRLSGSNPPAQGRGGPGASRPNARGRVVGSEPNYDRLLAIAKSLDPNWKTITLNVVPNESSPVQVTVDAGTGGQPQKRAQYLLNGKTGAVLKTTTFADGSLGQRLRSFVRFGHTGEWGGLSGQLIAAIASLAACFLVYTGLSLSIRRLLASRKRMRPSIPARIHVPEQALVEAEV